MKTPSVDVRIILKWIFTLFLTKILMIAEFLTYQLLHNKWDSKTHFEKKDCNHLQVPTYLQKLYKIKVTHYPYTLTLLHFSGPNRHPQGDINPKPYILLKHQIYTDNVQMYSSSHKYNNVANMDSMMLSCFPLKPICTPLFAVCAVIHTQTSSVAVFDLEKIKSLCLYCCVLCRRVLYEQYYRKNSSCAQKEIPKSAKHAV